MGDRLVSSRRAGGGDRSEVIAAGFDVPEVEIHEGNQPTVIGFFTYPNELVGECGGEVDLATSWQMDEAVVAYAQHVVVGRVVRIGEEGWVRLGGRHVDFGRALHVESFVRGGWFRPSACGAFARVDRCLEDGLVGCAQA